MTKLSPLHTVIEGQHRFYDDETALPFIWESLTGQTPQGMLEPVMRLVPRIIALWNGNETEDRRKSMTQHPISYRERSSTDPANAHDGCDMP